MGSTASTQTGGNRVRTYSEQEILQNINSLFKKKPKEDYTIDTLTYNYNAMGGTKIKTFESSKKRYLKHDISNLTKDAMHGGEQYMQFNDKATVPTFNTNEFDKITQFLSGKNNVTAQIDTDTITQKKPFALTDALKQITQSGGAYDDSEDMNTMENDLFDTDTDSVSDKSDTQNRLVGFNDDVTSSDIISDSETSTDKNEVKYDEYPTHDEGAMDIYAFYSSTDSDVTPHRNYY